jgi:hypothetical protein
MIMNIREKRNYVQGRGILSLIEYLFLYFKNVFEKN